MRKQEELLAVIWNSCKEESISGSKFQTYRSDAFLNKIAPSTIPTSQKNDNVSQNIFCGQKHCHNNILAAMILTQKYDRKLQDPQYDGSSNCAISD